jgi:cell division protein FtsI/penicillin-binding protein 2
MTDTTAPPAPPPPAPATGSPTAGRSRRTRRIVLAVVAVALVLAAVLVVQRARTQAEIEEQARQVGALFAAGWAADDFSQVPFAGKTGEEVTEDYYRLTDGLDEFAVTIHPRITVVTDDRAVSSYVVDWTFPDGAVWTTDARLEMVRRADQWQIEWSPTIVHPDLGADTRLVAERVIPERGQISGAGGQILVTDRAVVEVGVQPNRIADLGALATDLERLLGIKGADLITRVQGAEPDAFVAVITLRRTDYDPIRDELQPLPGTVFRERELPLGPSRTFARALLGTSGEVTAEVVERSNGRYKAGDVAGLSGMQARYDAVLAGEPGLSVFVTNAPPPGEKPKEGTDVALRLDLVFEQPAIAGSSVETTLDPDVQFAAEAAIEGVESPSSIVAVRPSTGEILAVANGPLGGDENLAFTGQYPPGSTFKVVTAEALLNHRMSTSEQVDCSATVAVGGREYRNAEYAALGRVPFTDAFASSCNTAFVRLSERLERDTLTQAATRFGIGTSWSVGMPAYTGSVPAAESSVDKASMALGQGNILVSPLGMAMVAATVADGTWRPPKLVTEPSGLGPGTEGDEPAGTPATEAELPDGEADDLQVLLREVVDGGSGWRALNVPGPAISGKTGTAEFGTEDPPRSHAWFIGYRGDLAFAVFVDGGEFGGETAVPIATDFLGRLLPDETDTP